MKLYLGVLLLVFTASAAQSQTIQAGWTKARVIDTLKSNHLQYTEEKHPGTPFPTTIVVASFPFHTDRGQLMVDLTAGDTAAMVTLFFIDKKLADFDNLCAEMETLLGPGDKDPSSHMERWMDENGMSSVNYSDGNGQLAIVKIDPRSFPKQQQEGGDAQELIAAYSSGDFDKAVKLADPKAQAGDAQAQLILGMLYFKGYGVAQSDEKAARWFEKASDQGVGVAKSLLSTLYENGRGVPMDTIRAIKLLKEASEAGVPMGQFLLGMHYYTGTSIAKDDAKAFPLIKSAAQSGMPDAEFQLGYMMTNGEGAAVDKKGAIEWLERAAQMKNTRAMGLLVPLYMGEEGIPKNIARAYAYSHLAAKYDPIQAATSGKALTEKWATKEDVEAANKIMRDLEAKWAEE